MYIRNQLECESLMFGLVIETTSVYHSSVKLALGLHKSCLSILPHVHCICAMILYAIKIWIQLC